MKLLLTGICSLLVTSLLITCRQPDPKPNVILDGTLQIKSISFSGIPQENVSIDQSTKVITIRMPERIPSNINIDVELTDNAEWVNKMIGARAIDLFGCDSCFHISLKDKNEPSAQSRVVYSVKPVPVASLGIDVISAPLTYFIRNASTSDLTIPMLNLYGNKLPKEAHLTYDKTGETLTIKYDPRWSQPFPNPYGIHYGRYANSLGIYLYNEKLAPGSYHVNLLLDDGATLKVPQPVLVTKGTIDIDDFDYESRTYFGYRVAVGKTLTIDGYNLFEGDITLDLLDKQDKVYPLPGLDFDRYGRYIQISMPATLSPGQYILRVWQNDIRFPYSHCLRVNLLKDEQPRPILGILGTDASPCSLRDPVPLQRNIRLKLTSDLRQQTLNQLSQHAAVKLLSLTTNAAYYSPVVAQDGNWQDTNSLIIPTTVPPGLYTAVLQVLDAQNNVVAESELYGRILDVK